MSERRDIGLYLVIEAGSAAEAQLSAAFAAADVQSLLIRPPRSAALDVAAARPLVEAAQRKGVAALVERDARLARTLKADGVHLPWSPTLLDDYRAARELLGVRGIVGVEAGSVRHDAMELAEAGADYVGFGLGTHDGASGGDETTRRSDRLDLVSWWAEIFEVPCVAFDAAGPDDVEALVAAGADFVAVSLAAGDTLAAASERVRAAARRLTHV